PNFIQPFNSYWLTSQASASMYSTSDVTSNSANNSFFHLFPHYTDIISASNGKIGKLTFLSLKFDVKRNYSIYAVIIPLLLVFYLLGAIFILSSRANLHKRVTLAVAVFAFIFAFTTVGENLKPLNPSGNPTFYDFLISTLVIATISFTVGSFISY